MKRKTALSAVLMAGGLAMSAGAMAETPSATMLAYTCAGCHGTNGNSNGPATPTLAGASKDYLIEVMEYYKTGERASTIMGRIAKGYTKEEIERIADFFSKQKFVPAKGQKFDPKLAKKGAKLHDKYCEKCHADGGTSSEDDAGILAGQWVPYLKYTLADMQAGKSHVPKKMKKKLKKLKKKAGDAGIEQLLNYYASRK
ncbi:c-type cytochrome [Thiolapillus sp.]